jgi:hypothetical protein
VLSIVSCVIVDAREVGVSYGRVAKDLPDPESVVKLLQESGITTVRLYDADPRVLKAFANTSIKVMVMLPNYEVAAVAVSPPFALQWVQRNVSAHADPRRGRWERGVRGGAGPDAAARPGHGQRAASAGRAGLADAIKVSTPIAFTALRTRSRCRRPGSGTTSRSR